MKRCRDGCWRFGSLPFSISILEKAFCVSLELPTMDRLKHEDTPDVPDSPSLSGFISSSFMTGGTEDVDTPNDGENVEYYTGHNKEEALMMISRAKRKRMISVEDEGSEQKARLGGGSSPRVGLGSPGVTFTSGGGAGGILGAAGAAGAAGAGRGAPGSESKTGKRVLAVGAVGACLEKGGGIHVTPIMRSVNNLTRPPPPNACLPSSISRARCLHLSAQPTCRISAWAPRTAVSA